MLDGWKFLDTRNDRWDGAIRFDVLFWSRLKTNCFVVLTLPAAGWLPGWLNESVEWWWAHYSLYLKSYRLAGWLAGWMGVRWMNDCAMMVPSASAAVPCARFFFPPIHPAIAYSPKEEDVEDTLSSSCEWQVTFLVTSIVGGGAYQS